MRPSEEIWNTAIDLLKRLSPGKSREEYEKVANFGFDLAACPQDFIDVLNEKISMENK